MPTDIVFLVADKNIEHGMRGLLVARSLSEFVRSTRKSTCIRRGIPHAHRNPMSS